MTSIAGIKYLLVSEINFEGLGALIDVLIYAVEHPGWSLAVVLFFGFLVTLSSAAIRLVHYALVSDHYEKSRVGAILIQTALFAFLIYILYIFLFQTIFPPDLSPILDLFNHLPRP
jgi:ATP/ADP translocase